MHQYKIVATVYSEVGALTDSRITVYADSAEQAQQKFEQYSKATQENGMWAYNVRLYTAAYKPITEPADFFQQFQIV